MAHGWHVIIFGDRISRLRAQLFKTHKNCGFFFPQNSNQIFVGSSLGIRNFFFKRLLVFLMGDEPFLWQNPTASSILSTEFFFQQFNLLNLAVSDLDSLATNFMNKWGNCICIYWLSEAWVTNGVRIQLKIIGNYFQIFLRSNCALFQIQFYFLLIFCFKCPIGGW